MNFIHDSYRGSISNDDMLYTLAQFVTMPIVWIQKYGYRKLEEWEIHAIVVFWKEIAGRMGIENVPSTIQEYLDRTERYESRNMVFADTNKTLYDAVMSGLLKRYPTTALKNVVDDTFKSLLTTRERTAFGYSIFFIIYFNDGFLLKNIPGLKRLLNLSIY